MPFRASHRAPFPFSDVPAFAAAVKGGMKVDKWVMWDMARAGNLACLVYAIEKMGKSVPWEAQYELALRGNLDAVRYLHTQGDLRYEMMMGAVDGNHPEVLEFAMTHARKQGETPLLAPAAGTPLLESAAYRGNVGCIDVMRRLGLPMSVHLLEMAIQHGQPEVARYLVEHHPPCKDVDAGRHLPVKRDVRHLECIKIAHEHGCSIPPVLVREVVRTFLLPKWRAHVRVRGIGFFWQDCAARTSHAPGGAGRKRDREAFEGDFA